MSHMTRFTLGGLLCLVGVSATSSRGDDAVSLVQLDAEAGTQRRSCTCLPWADVYKQHHVLCGQGFEFYAWTGKALFTKSDPLMHQMRAALGDEFCTKFFERMDSNRAVRMKFMTPTTEMHAAWDKSWCYVSPECEVNNIDGFKVPDTHLGVKRATSMVGDVVFADMNPYALQSIAKVEGLDLGILSSFAYYTEVDPDEKRVSLSLAKKVMSKGVTTILQPSGHLEPRILIDGPTQRKWMVMQDEQQTVNPGSWWKTMELAEEEGA